MSAFILKIIAIIAMTMNHIAHVFGNSMPDWLYYICMGVGGMTFPIMAYLMSEGYKYTRNVKKYALRLLLFALLALFPFFFTMGYMLNVLFTFLLGLLGLYLYDHMKSRVGFVFVFILLVLLSLVCDWQLMGVPMILLYHTIKNKYARVIVPLTITWGVMGLLVLSGLLSTLFMPDMAMSMREVIANALYGFVGCTATIPILLNYNGKKGPSMKYLFYAYYPAHLAVLWLIQYAVNR